MQLWRRLTRQLTRREVRALLGEPARVDPGPAGGDIETWLYEYAAAGESPARVAGSVAFSIGRGHVVTWVEPEWKAVHNAD